MAETVSLLEQMRREILQVVLELHTALPGAVVSYRAATQTADVKPLPRWNAQLPWSGKTLIDLPVLPDVLVCHPRAGELGVHYPLESGDPVLLVFCGRSISTWRARPKDRRYDPGDHQAMPLSGVVALPLLHHDSIAWGQLASGSGLRLGRSGGSFDYVAHARKTDDAIAALQQVLDTHIHMTTATVGTGGPGVISPPTTTAGVQPSVAAADVEVS